MKRFSDRVFVSLSSAGEADLSNAIDALLSEGFSNIELSGGTVFNQATKDILLNYKENSNVKFHVHNYFPAPDQSFALNLSSDREETIAKSLQLISEAIELSALLETGRYSVHAGFLLDPNPSELGAGWKKAPLLTREKGWENFIHNFSIIQDMAASRNVQLFVENNVLSKKNKEMFGANPFLFTDSSDAGKITENLGMKVLLDLGHLKVSCTSLGIDFGGEVSRLATDCIYFHLSNNSGQEDENKGLAVNDDIISAVPKKSFLDENVIFTIEVYDCFRAIRESQSALQFRFEMLMNYGS